MPNSAALVGFRFRLLYLSVLADRPIARKSRRLLRTETLRGRVVFLAEAMEKQRASRSVPEAKDRILALETEKGELIPLLEDVRGRAFRRDERLRKMQVELLVRRYRSLARGPNHSRLRGRQRRTL